MKQEGEGVHLEWETGEVIEVEARGLVCETNGMMVH